MRRLALAIAAAAAATLIWTSPSHSQSSKHNYNIGPASQDYAPSARKRHKRDRSHDAERKRRLKKECRMYAFGPWRYHPNYKHCRYY